MTEEIRRARGEAWAAYFRVELLTDDRMVLGTAADALLSHIRDLKEIDDLAELDRDAEAARLAINRMIREARRLTIVTKQADRGEGFASV